MAGRLPRSASIAQRGHGARPGHLPGPLCTEARARPRGKPGPGAVAARLQALASRGPGAAGCSRGGTAPPRHASLPRPGAGRAGGGRGRARAAPRLPGSSGLCAPLSRWPPQELSAPGWGAPCASLEAPVLPLSSYIPCPHHASLPPAPASLGAQGRGAQVQGSGYPGRGDAEARSQ